MGRANIPLRGTQDHGRVLPCSEPSTGNTASAPWATCPSFSGAHALQRGSGMASSGHIALPRPRSPGGEDLAPHPGQGG